ncbi:acyl carrier protein [Agarilytica rhodophyticola]|uniref:acyl carrier protein n=1 Tax=Agarilytica rhodophyticola TaxID=1737490 RepID=UPI000B34544C|nr:acyl carrier protein [Agarilytica rhodophyticola]
MFSLDDLKEIIKARFKMDLSAVSDNETLEAIGFDSLSQLDLAQAIKKKYGIRITDNDMESISTLKDIVLFVSGKLS